MASVIVSSVVQLELSSDPSTVQLTGSLSVESFAVTQSYASNVIDVELSTNNIEDPVNEVLLPEKLKSSHLVADELFIALSGPSDPGLLPPGLVAVADPFHATTDPPLRNRKSATCIELAG